MVVDVQKLSDALRRSSPELELRRDLERLIGARRQEIEEAVQVFGYSAITWVEVNVVDLVIPKPGDAGRAMDVDLLHSSGRS